MSAWRARGANLAVSCRTRGHSTAARLHDLSPEGCLLDSGNGFLIAGDCVTLRFACGVRVAGRVTLLHGRMGRVEFDQPLHQAVLAHILNQEGQVGAASERQATGPQRTGSGTRSLS